MAQEQTHTKGALRAIAAILKAGALELPEFRRDETIDNAEVRAASIEEAAEIIDRETGLPNLLKACEGLVRCMDGDTPGRWKHCRDLDLARAAIAKAK